MKYWLLTTEYPPFYGGGIGTYSYMTARMMSQKGHEFTVFVPDNGVNDHKVGTENGIQVIRFNTNRKSLYNTLGYTARLSYEFADIVRTMIQLSGKPDFLEAQDYLGIAYYLLQFQLANDPAFKNIPVLITLHSPAFLYLEYNRVATYKFPDYWTGEMEKQSIAAASHIISPSVFLPGELQNHMDLSKKTVHIVPNPYECNEEMGVKTFEPNRIVFFGKLSPQKGVFALLEYLKDMWDEGFQIGVELIGGTEIVYHPEHKTMGKIVEERYGTYMTRGLLKITGKISPSAITDKLNSAHVVLAPSIVDNLPYAVMEAMSRKAIVLTSLQGGQKEIIHHGYDGYLFDHAKKDDFKTQLLKILSLSDKEVTDCGERAAKRIQDAYSFQKIYEEKIGILKSINNFKQKNSTFPFLYQEAFQPLQEETNDMLSVVIPYFNMDRYISECIDSILQSTYKSIEILIINDGSTDDISRGVIETLSGHAEITIYNNTNQGLAFSRNFGAEKARGKYLAFLDADDKVAPLYYEKAINILTTYENVFFVGCWSQYFQNSSKIWPGFTPQPPYALVHNPINSSALVYKRAAYVAAGRNDKAVDYGLEDYESVVALLHKGYNGFVLPECLFFYRVRTGSMSRRINANKLIYAYKYITEKHKSYYSKFAPQVINLLNANGPGYSYDNPTISSQGLLKNKAINLLYLTLKGLVNKSPKTKMWLLEMVKKTGLTN